MNITYQTLIKAMLFAMLFIFIAIYFQNCAQPGVTYADDHGSSDFMDSGDIPSDGFGPCFRGEFCDVPPQSTTCFDPREYYELTEGVFCHRRDVTTTTLQGN